MGTAKNEKMITDDREVKDAFRYLEKNESSMSLHQISFVGSLKKYFVKTKRLSDKQRLILFEIKNYVEVAL